MKKFHNSRFPGIAIAKVLPDKNLHPKVSNCVLHCPLLNYVYFILGEILIMFFKYEHHNIIPSSFSFLVMLYPIE